MILTCANCEARYLVPDGDLGRDGRRVRCTNCDHEWFQEPEDYEEDVTDDDDLEPIPEAVKPLPDEESLVPASHDFQEEEPAGEHIDWAGYAAAAGVFFLITIMLVALKGPVSKNWPATAAFYGLLGMETPVVGEGLIFEQLKAVSTVNEENIQVLKVSGRVINLKKQEKSVPAIQATLRTDLGEDIDSWVVDPGQDSVDPDGELSFETAYPEIDETVKEVNIQFLLGDKGMASEIHTVHEGQSHEEAHESPHGNPYH